MNGLLNIIYMEVKSHLWLRTEYKEAMEPYIFLDPDQLLPSMCHHLLFIVLISS
jgi:hypothetical protein